MNWNREEILFEPSGWAISCYVDATAPFPSPVRSVQVDSIQFIASSMIRVVASWEEPAEVNGLLVAYSICIGEMALKDLANCEATTVNITVC